MRPLWFLLELAVNAAQDEVAALFVDEEVELRRLAEWLREHHIDSVTDMSKVASR